ncbi:MAG TPA: prenyltransferase/squalene oxidase repeat-containing protein [Actinocrinis sp.]|uniref:prenyltransferase/squalene oxidase repeat-containing protein n=1 Tax=Actinocrinis sp. TaxID=1920516 RepID=UPI002DDDAB4A|nr:prenyltransferase/squalene oxidase repeat-containing protein [Actinocrinis sp.]HEV3171080.1 prenyltransferase/squalene oxidase repeat-containing protein [Actinocrinis sp.]
MTVPVNAASSLDGMRARAESWLLARQDASGAWTLPLRPGVSAPSVAMTVLALTALDDGDAPHSDAVGQGVTWLAARQNPDGSFGDGEDGRYYRPYCTALALWMLPGGAGRHAAQIIGAVDYLRRNQRHGSLDHGGIGHGMVAPAPTPQDPHATFTRTFAMISPTSMAAEGMRRAGVLPGDPFLTGVIEYVRSCQNDLGVNTRPDVLDYLAGNGFQLSGDGGIVSTLENLRRPPGWTRRADADPVVASGISTCQGLTAYLRSGLSPDAPEAAAALRWIRDHYSVTEHAGFADVMHAGQRPLWPTEHGGFRQTDSDDMTQAGWYLYVFSLAQALDGAGVEVIQTADGTRHACSAELGAALRAAQSPEGCWTNPNPRWLEFDAVLSTAFALSTINILSKKQ